MAFRLIIRLPETEPSPAFVRVGGVPVLLRLLIGGYRQGAEQIEVTGPGVEEARRLFAQDRRLGGADISWGPAAGPRKELPVVETEANVVVGGGVWELLDKATGPAEVPGAPLMRRLGEGKPEPLWTGEPPSKNHFAIPASDSAGAWAAKRAIFRNVFKPTSGPVSIHFNSKLSIPVSWLLSETPVTPNQITVFTTLIGFVSAWAFSLGTFAGFLTGGVLFQLCAALDRCDGEIARSKYMDSPSGAWVDTVGDNVTYVAYLTGLTLGYARFAGERGNAWAPYVHAMGFGTLGLTVFLLGGMYLYLYRNKKSGTLVAVYKDFESRVDGKKAGFVYRFLDSIKILGKRDSWSLAIGVAALLGGLFQAAFFYHLIFFATVGTIVLMNIYFTVARRNVSG